VNNDSIIVLDAGAILSPFERYSPGRIVIRGDRVEAAGARSDVAAPPEATPLSLPELTLVPGFIEPHVHGCAGFDVMDATPESMNTICRTLARHGTTAFLPTTVSAPIETLTAAVENLSSLIGVPFEGARPLGIHLEGPFINLEKRGTHQPANVHKPDAGILSDWVRRSNARIKLLTLAPELEGITAVAQIAARSGVTVAMGHSDASFSEATQAANGGVHYAVHTFNAMRQFSHRDSGIVGAVLSDDRIFAEIIADGVHVAPEVVRLFAKAKSPRRIILATDATSATGMPDGHYSLGGNDVQVTGGVCRDAEGRLAGSTLTQDQALRNLLLWSDMRFEDALLAVTANPADALRLKGRGRIEPGAFADFTLLDKQFQVARTYVGGVLVFERAT
jgi:N-acetylglucosamine-6-phosphate deacetylase